jgi:RNA-directed DNA polymerase
VKDRTKTGIGTDEQVAQWDAIEWRTVEKRVRNLRRRIYRATKLAQWNKVRSLMKLMLRSYSNLLSSVRRVTQENTGRKTPGIDRQVVLSPKARMALVRKMLKYTLWKASPARRIYIPKADGKTRPLGIPTIQNRVAQSVVKNSLEPSWEARFEANSYGFRPGRSCHDAIKHVWQCLNRSHNDRWVLDADIKGAFDNISHDYVLRALGFTPGRELIKQWLKAGYVEAEIFHATEAGVPQGGIISPLISNIALDGMQQLLKGKAHLIRYADDFVATAPTRRKIEAIVPVIEQWLQERGLVMHPEKTRIVHVDDGFDFLGFTVKHYKRKCLFRPQKEKVLSFLQEIRQWLKRNRSAAAEHVIRHLNPILIGWSNYYKHASSKRTFAYVQHQIRSCLWKWCLRRHPNKGKEWVRKKYFWDTPRDNWKFFSKVSNPKSQFSVLYLYNMSYLPIERHIKVRDSASPDDPTLQEYWYRRQTKGNVLQRKNALWNNCDVRVRTV